MVLSRLVLDFRPDGHELRVLYRTKAGPAPGTKARQREVTQLARDGLTRALAALEEGPVESVGTSGYEVREDTLSLVAASPNAPKLVKGDVA